MNEADFWIVLVGAAVATYAARAVFLVPDATKPPARFEPALRLVGPAVLAALAIPAILRAPGTGSLDLARVVSGAIAFGVAWRTKSVAWTIVAGFAALVAASAAWP
ncbi:MAG TPA: AzlD domain-containing protein [Candidatus Thermoplasmatota archaeon]|nr:AzlD domain-containing protein [Candidatus Thermoplasmatota archaeon]